MADASFRVVFAGPLVSFQDAGRPGHMRFGVPASGPMDRLAHAAANVALGEAADATAIEISMGGLVLECLSGAITLALAGGAFGLGYGDQKASSWIVFSIDAGEKLTIRPGGWGSWCYLAFAGDLDAPLWLEHSATHSISGFGGGLLQTGQKFTAQNARVEDAREGSIAAPDIDQPDREIRVVMGPQDHHFQRSAIDAFLDARFTLTDAYDRMGMRLSGPKLDLNEALSIPSEPILRGSVQVAGDGVPTVLMADHQTTGGYPKIATVISADLDRLSQLRAKDTIAFEQVEPEKALLLARDRAGRIQNYLAAIAEPKGTLLQRLMKENLISGVLPDDPKR